MPRFSIVIPAYNVEAYLEQCLDSLLAQTFGDWEAVVVDDASPDGSGALADRLAASDPRITVVHKAANEGTHLARRTGMERCCGEYTVFLDGDDSLKPDCLALLDEALSADPVDSIHYGLVAQAAGSTSDEAAKATKALINSSIATVEEGSQAVNRVTEALERTAVSASHVTEKMSIVVGAVETQTGAIVQVTEGMDQISSVVQTNSATAQQSAAASEELSAEADSLKQLVEHFTLAKK